MSLTANDVNHLRAPLQGAVVADVWTYSGLRLTGLG